MNEQHEVQASTQDQPPQDDIEHQPSAGLSLHCDLTGSISLNTEQLLGHFQAVLAYLEIQQISLEIVLIEDERMAEMHEQFTGVSGTTDVITFDYLNQPNQLGEHEQVEGELYVCVDEAGRQAEQRGHDLLTELLLYMTHGLLHLLGYDDHDPQDHQLMHQKEDEILKAIGVGEVYHRDLLSINPNGSGSGQGITGVETK